ncbi:hypothetical protein GAMM_170090 [Gammaproteobacteria bacterium]
MQLARYKKMAFLMHYGSLPIGAWSMRSLFTSSSFGFSPIRVLPAGGFFNNGFKAHWQL